MGEVFLVSDQLLKITGSEAIPCVMRMKKLVLSFLRCRIQLSPSKNESTVSHLALIFKLSAASVNIPIAVILWV